MELKEIVEKDNSVELKFENENPVQDGFDIKSLNFTISKEQLKTIISLVR